MTGRLVLTSSFCFAWLGIVPVAAQGALTTQSPADAQPTVAKRMPDLTIPSYSDGGGTEPKRAHVRRASSHRHYVRHRDHQEPIERPALANVELLETLPRPPEPPHTVVPVPAYPFESFTAAFTTPPPPIVCQPTRYDRFKPDLGLVDERPVLCTADNP